MASQYKKHTHREHILELPDTYIGSVETSVEPRWVFDETSGRIVHKHVNYNPGLYKTFDELVVNARDALVRAQTDSTKTPVKRIDISAKMEENRFTVRVKNDGDGIPVEIHPTEKCYAPELIFGHLLTSSNYDKTEEKTWGGKNGYGAKCLARDTPVPTWDGVMKKAENLEVGDKIIGDDGKVRNILSITKGTGQMYKISQAHAEPYTVNDQHTLTLTMPDHKVIFWNSSKHAWSVLWWDNKEKKIKAKYISVEKSQVVCEECHQTLSGNLKRHYNRIHKAIPLPNTVRKGPTKEPEMTDGIRKARDELERFCESIDDNCVFDMDIQDYIALNETTKKRISGVRGQCVEWEKKEVFLDPYVLGLWLGDGVHTGYTYACYGEKDPEIIDYLSEWGKKNDATIKKTNSKYVYHISSTSNFGKKGSSPLKNQLEKYNLIKNKHIPNDYLCNDRETRLAVLAGFIDTDGSVSRDGTRVTISQGSNHKELLNQLEILTRSLGFCVKKNTIQTSWTHNGEKRKGIGYHLNISGEHLADIPTRLPRKKCANTVVRKTSTTTGFLTIEDAGQGDYLGIHIDGNERFLINDFTVTHNCTNVFSNEFQVHTRDPKNQLIYSQTWKQNMSVCEKPSVRKDKSTKGFVEVVYVPDLARFRGVSSDNKNIHADMVDILHTRAIEIAALVGKDVKVTWNDVEIKADTFDKYVRLFLREDAEKTYVYEKCGDRWEVAAVPTKYLFSEDAGTPEDRHISFVNGINTRKGGKHVETVQRAILDDLCEAAMKKRKLDLKIGQIKDHVTLFVSATIVNPAFDSQTKENLTTPSKNFGSKPVFSGKIIDGLIKAGILDDAQAIMDAKMNREAKKTDGGKKRKVFVEKLNDAPKAGTSESEKCTLILTEGDSAKTAAVAGVQVMNQDYWGIFPLRGKVLNVKDISRDKINANEELVNLKKILGLETGKVYKNLNELRYGRIMIMCDQDVDGFHIRGLLMNLFHAEWPSLMKLNFLCSLMTPLVKLTKGQEVLSFYSEAELENWRNSIGAEAADKYKVKYYKGLGTSGAAEAREWFQKLAEVKYEWDEKTDDTLDMAFNKKRADDRKQWLASYNPKKTMMVPEDRKVGFSDFVNDELIHFSSADNLRSIPHIMDGLKPSQRKILYSCFKRNLTQEIKVAQLAGYVSEHSAYHHGEASLNQSIINMAQVFVGANNLNLLFPSGQFGSRIMGGKDSSAPRYIFTRLEKISGAIYKKEDVPLLKHNVDDGDIVEPEHYLPVIPMLLVNGTVGIGSGYSTTVFPHNPTEIVDCLKQRLRGDVTSLNDVVLDPWWIGYQGNVIRKGEKEWATKGKYTFDNTKKTVTITELPVDMWIDNYKSMLQKMLNEDSTGKKNALKDFDFTNSLNSVKIVLYLDADYHASAQKDLDEFEKRFDLNSNHKGTNMCCFDPNMNLVKYNTAGEIMEVFFQNRLVAYEERRKHLIKVIKDEIEEYTAKYKFVMGILDGTIKIMNQEDDVIVDSLVRCGIPPRSDRANPQNIGAYDYLLRMRVDRIKKSSVEEAKKDVEVAQEKRKVLENTTAVNMWLGELEEFLVAWEDHKQAMLTMIEGVGSTSGVGKGSSGKTAGPGMNKAKALAIAKAKAKASAATKANVATKASVTIDV